MIKKKLIKEYLNIQGRSYKSLNIENFCTNISNVDWDEIFATSDPNEIWRKMKVHFTLVINKHCPEREFRIHAECPSYLGEELILMMKDRDEVFRMVRRRGDERSWGDARI